MAASSDRYTMGQRGVPSPRLMQRAALCMSHEVLALREGSDRPAVVAVDLPTGVVPDCGAVEVGAVPTACTVTCLRARCQRPRGSASPRCSPSGDQAWLPNTDGE